LSLFFIKIEYALGKKNKALTESQAKHKQTK
jgi:hypothetical protein